MAIVQTANRVLSALALLCAAIAAHAACRSDTEICVAGSPWMAANFATVLVQDNASDERGFLRLSFADPGNVRIESETNDQGRTRKSTVMLVDSQILLTKDIASKPGDEIYALDGPVLIYQLVIGLLTAAFPEGPDEFKRRSIIELEETRRGILVATSSTSGFYRAPWRVKGSINRTNAESIVYGLEFEFSAGGARRVLTLNGLWARNRTRPAFDMAMPLADWNAYLLQDYTIHPDSPKISGGAKPISPGAGTLAELQYALRTNPPWSFIAPGSGARPPGEARR